MLRGKAKAQALNRRRALVNELLDCAINYAPQQFVRDDVRDTVAFVSQRIVRIQELIDRNNEPAAHWCGG